MEDKKSEKDQILDELITWRKHSEIKGMVEHWKFLMKTSTKECHPLICKS